jgi:flagellar assembly factor FliW
VIESTRLGKLDVSEEEILKFPKGLPGFQNETAFAVIPHGDGSPFAFLQSASEPDLTFLVVDPFTFFSDYQFELDDEYAREMGIAGDVPFQVFNIVTVPEKVEEMTANLLAPIIVNWQTRTAEQIVLGKTVLTTRHRLFPEGFPKKPNKGGK